MATALEEFKRLKAEAGYGESWLNLIGKRYSGGGGGIGKIHKLTLKVEVYNQPSDGANNYHDIPAKFAEYVAQEIVKDFGVIAAKAIDRMLRDVKEKAKLAHAEQAELAKAAGLAEAIAV